MLFDDEVEKAESLETPILFDEEQKFDSVGVKMSELDDDWGDEKEVIEDSGGGGVDGSLSILFSMF